MSLIRCFRLVRSKVVCALPCALPCATTGHRYIQHDVYFLYPGTVPGKMRAAAGDSGLRLESRVTSSVLVRAARAPVRAFSRVRCHADHGGTDEAAACFAGAFAPYGREDRSGGCRTS